MQGVTLHALVDSCHSGTVMNLPYNAVLEDGMVVDWEEEYPGETWKRVSQMEASRGHLHIAAAAVSSRLTSLRDCGRLELQNKHACQLHLLPCADHCWWLGCPIQRSGQASASE
jgi:hypothetical protein